MLQIRLLGCYKCAFLWNMVVIRFILFSLVNLFLSKQFVQCCIACLETKCWFWKDLIQTLAPKQHYNYNNSNKIFIWVLHPMDNQMFVFFFFLKCINQRKFTLQWYYPRLSPGVDWKKTEVSMEIKLKRRNLCAQSNMSPCSASYQASSVSVYKEMLLKLFGPFDFLCCFWTLHFNCDFSTWPQAPASWPPPLLFSPPPCGCSSLEPPELLHTYPHTYIKWEVAVLLS